MNNAEFNTGVIRPVECYKEAWEIIKDEYILIWAITFVGLMIGGVIPIIISGPMLAGIYYCMFKKIDGEKVSFEQLFRGFDYFLPSAILMAVITIPLIIVIVGVYIPIVLASMAGVSPDEMLTIMISSFAIEVVFAFLMVCLHTLIMFSIPLIVDRKMGAWESIKVSAKAVMANKSGVVGLFVVGFVIVMLGYLALCIGVYFVLPLMIAGTAVAYRKVFPSEGTPNLTPPPPDSYQDAGKAA